MSTAEELKETYSFIGALESDAVLASHGNNALPLFAVGLHLGVEDLANFATESLTDSPNDKKADIIYINEAEGIACIAQGTTAAEWGKPEAPANKASALNAAVAWLLTKPLGDVPEKIQGQAKLLREGLSEGTITRLILAYAHNAYESPNVDRELQAARELVSTLFISQECEIECIELGLRNIERLYLTSQGSIQVTDKVHFPATQCIKETNYGWKAFVITINGAKLFDLFDAHKSALFSANLRDFMGTRKAERNVNNKIKTTAESSSDDFYIFNNGITIVCNKADHKDGNLEVHGISVVNGAQTIGAIHAAGPDHGKNVSVLARVIEVYDHATIPDIVTANNTQNAIRAWDRKSNNPVQTRLGREFSEKGIKYVHRRDNARNPSNSIFADQIGQMLCAFGGNLQTAIRAKAAIFEEDTIYNAVFPSTLAIGHVFGIQALGWAYDKIKQDLKSKAASESLTVMEQKQLRLLDYPASKQFLIRVMGDLREEISGRGIPNPQELALLDKAITPDGQEAVDAWLKVITAVLPTIVQDLPSEEYQVVRSTDHTNSVVGRAKGIIAGALVLHTSFEDLRGLLRSA